MWRPFQSSGTLYVTRIKEGNDQLHIALTNFMVLWENIFTTKQLERGFKQCNPVIEASMLAIKNNALDLLYNIRECEVLIEKRGEDVELQIKRELSEQIKSEQLVFKYILQKKEEALFKDYITVPLIQTVFYLETQQRTLLSAIERKDRELEEHRMEKGEISRNDLKTEKFDPGSLQRDSKLFLNVFEGSLLGNLMEIFNDESEGIALPTPGASVQHWNLKPKRKKVYSSKTVVKKGSGISYNKK
ncbi:uncharacterized protein LOC132701842 isoform X2 [Cylas formicarius]|uniref:uncharacterized protein LOC132701842 isoform X2 n=1 Tax=Cylas formicarius TaxID=197179 RepID=UPI002958AF57|nr:uncharacterized protein LOC132701842 isoform X2 [Cylas formicarius]